MRLTRLAIPKALLVLLLSTLICLSLFARAGGGGGFGGGGGGFGGGGFGGGRGFGGGGFSLGRGSGGGSGVLVSPAFIIICIVGAAIVIAWINTVQHHHSTVIRRKASNLRQPQNSINDEANKIKERDHDFDLAVFANRVYPVFMKVQEAWSAGDMHPVRHLVSDGVYERFSLQISMMAEQKLRNIMNNIEVKSIVPASVVTDNFFDEITVAVCASAKDRYINMELDCDVGSASISQEFVEYWSFLRRPGAKTLKKAGLMESCCPNCGAELDIVDKTECPSCKAIVNSGDYDWVLAEITQESEWNFIPRRQLPGLEKMLAKDPAFNIQHIEDRVSVMFWRYIASGCFSSYKYLAKLATPDFMREHRDEFTCDSQGRRRFFADAAVGSIETVAIESSDDPSSIDRIHLKVRWSGHYETARLPGFVSPAFEQSHIYSQEFIIERLSNSKTSGKNILNSIHCPNCGAPETHSGKPFCEYCKAPLNDGSRDWVLADIRPYSRWNRHIDENKQDFNSIMDAINPDELIAAAVSIMLADGKVDDAERKFLKQIASRHGISGDRLMLIVSSVQNGTWKMEIPEDNQQAGELFKAMIRMSLADGYISGAEYKLIKKLADQTGYVDYDIKRTIAEERTRMYKAAKKAGR